MSINLHNEHIFVNMSHNNAFWMGFPVSAGKCCKSTSTKGMSFVDINVATGTEYPQVTVGKLKSRLITWPVMSSIAT